MTSSGTYICVAISVVALMTGLMRVEGGTALSRAESRDEATAAPCCLCVLVPLVQNP